MALGNINLDFQTYVLYSVFAVGGGAVHQVLAMICLRFWQED